MKTMNLFVVLLMCLLFSNCNSRDDNDWFPPIDPSLTPLPGSYSVGGTVSGLSGTVVLQNNGAADITLSQDSSFTFPNILPNKSAFAITIKTQPEGQDCKIVTHAKGVINSADITNVAVICTPRFYTIGGTVSGYSASGLFTLQNNAGRKLAISKNGPFTFPKGVISGSPYLVTMHTQPSGQICTVSQGSGTVALGDVTSVSVTCNSPAAGRIVPASLQKTGSSTLCPPEDPACEPGLGNLYSQKPSDRAIQDIQDDFAITWTDDPASGLTWPKDFDFDQTSKQPSKTVIISALNVLKNERFLYPLPFTDLSIYEYVKKNIHEINIRLNCGLNANGDGTLNLNATSGSWFGLESDTCTSTSQPAHYIDALQLYVHEARHSEEDDPGHTSCGISGGSDPYFEDGSGYAYAAMYLMWVYKYSLNDSPATKELAKENAISLLQDRFCEKPTHSNPKVQAIIDELLP